MKSSAMRKDEIVSQFERDLTEYICTLIVRGEPLDNALRLTCQKAVELFRSDYVRAADREIGFHRSQAASLKAVGYPANRFICDVMGLQARYAKYLRNAGYGAQAWTEGDERWQDEEAVDRMLAEIDARVMARKSL